MDVATLVLHVDATRLHDGERALDSFQQKGERAERSILSFADSATKSFSQARTAALSMVAAYASINSATELIRLADSWTMISARLEVVTGSTHRAIAAQRELFEMSQRTQTDLQSNAALFARTSQAMSDMGKSYMDTVKLTQAVGQGLAIGGAGTQESSATMLQLSQALGSGVLQGDEFRSLMENAPYLMQKLADAIGVPKGELKKLSSEGKLTSEVVANALLKASDQISKDAEKIPQTASRGMQYLTNSFGKFIDEQNRVTGASANLGKALKLVGDNLDSVAGLAVVAGGALSGKLLSGITASVAASVELRTASQLEAQVKLQALNATEQKRRTDMLAASSARFVAEAEAERAVAIMTSARNETILAQKEVERAAARLGADRQVGASVAQLAAAEQRLAAAKQGEAAASARLEVAENGLATSRLRATSAAEAHTVASNSLTVAKEREAAASSMAGIAARGAGTAIGALGGPIGIAITGFTLLATQVDLFSSAAERAAEKGVNAINRIRAAFAEGNVVAARKPRDELFAESDQADKRVQELEQRLAGLRARGGFGGGPRAAQMGQDGASVEELEKMIVQARRNAAAIRGQAVKADAAYRESKLEREHLDQQNDPTVLAQAFTAKYMADLKNADNSRRMAAEIEEENAGYEKALMGAKSAERKAEVLALHREKIANIQERYAKKEPGHGGSGLSRGEKGVSGLEGDIRSLTQMIDQYSQLGTAAEKLTEGEKQYNRILAERNSLAGKKLDSNSDKSIAARAKELADLDKQLALAKIKISLEKSVEGRKDYYKELAEANTATRAAEAYLGRIQQFGAKAEKLTEAEKRLIELKADREALVRAPLPADGMELTERNRRIWTYDQQIEARQGQVDAEGTTQRELNAKKYTDELNRQIMVLGIGSSARDRYLYSLMLEENQISSTSSKYQKLMALYDKHVAKSRDFVTGWDAAMADYLDSTSNNARAAGAIFNTMTSSMEAGLVQFFETGKLGWREFSVSVLREINKIMAAKAAAGLLSSAGGWFSSGAGGLMNFAAGMIGGGATQAAAPIVDGTIGPGRAFGGPVYPNTLHPVNERGMPELLMYGGSQFLMMPGQGGHVMPLMPAMGGSGRPAEGSGGDVVINQTVIYQDGSGKQTQGDGHGSAMMTGMADAMRTICRRELAAELRPGGLFYKARGG
ncbi:tape measure protein [Chromobacterium piscinae]|uniref:tape measure protein n=1 Tax=Chromobacterium piscinae TaxID=686831 RepID=UPI003F7DDDE9